MDEDELQCSRIRCEGSWLDIPPFLSTMTVKRTSQSAVETVSQRAPASRITQEGIEVASTIGNQPGKLSQLAVEVVSTHQIFGRASQLVIEVAGTHDDIGGTQPLLFVVT